MEIHLFVLHHVTVFRVEREGFVPPGSLDHEDVVRVLALTVLLHAGQDVSEVSHFFLEGLFSAHLRLEAPVEMIVYDVVSHLPHPQHLSVRVSELPQAACLGEVEPQVHDVLGVQAGPALEQHEGLVKTLHDHHQVQLTVQLLHVGLHGFGFHQVPGGHAGIQGDGVVQFGGPGHMSLHLIGQRALKAARKPGSLWRVGHSGHSAVVHHKVLPQRIGQQVVVVVGGGDETRQRLSHDGAVEGVGRHEAVQRLAVVDHVVEEDVVLLALGQKQGWVPLGSEGGEVVAADVVEGFVGQGDVEVVVEGVASHDVGHRRTARLVHLADTAQVNALFAYCAWRTQHRHMLCLLTAPGGHSTG